MSALTIAFDITIVGALALPWVYFAIHLLLFEGEHDLLDWLGQQKWTNNQGLVAAAGVLLFAMVYTLGSAVSRIAQDFFNDDDLSIPWVFRMTMTEDRIIATVYCEADEDMVMLPAAASPSLLDKIKSFRSQKSNCCNSEDMQQPEVGTQVNEKKHSSLARRSRTCKGTDNSATTNTAGMSAAEQPPCLCEHLVSSTWRHSYEKRYGDAEGYMIDTARDIFGLEENALLLKGEDASMRLRQLHDQIMVLRGATFNGLLALSFCLFGWGVKAQHEKFHRFWRLLFALLPAIFLFLAANALTNHYREREIGEPPYMEFSLCVIGLAGAWLLWVRPLLFRKDTREHRWVCWRWGTLSLVFAVLVAAGVLGWWSTEALYGRQVIYSYNSQRASSTQ